MIYINDIPSFRAPESETFTFDDRTEKIPLIRGNVVQSYGHIKSGDTCGLTCVFTAENYNRLEELWESGARVSYTDENGDVQTNLRLYFRRKRKLNMKFASYVVLEFELWRI